MGIFSEDRFVVRVKGMVRLFVKLRVKFERKEVSVMVGMVKVEGEVMSLGRLVFVIGKRKSLKIVLWRGIFCGKRRRWGLICRLGGCF